MALTQIGKEGITGISNSANANAITINNSEHVGIGTASPDGTLHVHSASAGSVTANTDADDLVVENSSHAGINILSPDANRSAIQFGHTSDNLKLQIRHDGATSLSQIISDDALNIFVGGSERIRINSSGNVGIGTSSPSSYYAKDLVISSPDEGGITIVQGTGHRGYLAFADGTSGSAQYRGYVSYDHNDDMLYLGTDGGGKLFIDTSGNVGVGTSTATSYYAKDLVVSCADQGGITLVGGTSNSQYLMFADGTSGTDRYKGYIQYAHNVDSIYFATNSASQVRIHSNGVLSASDGIALGVGTENTASNVLDDYEEGTWTLNDQSGAGLSITVYVSTYTKIGNQVFFEFGIVFPTNSNTTDLKLSLPFTAKATSDNTGGGGISTTNSGRNDTLVVIRNTAHMVVQSNLNVSAKNNNYSGKQLRAAGQYTAQ